MSQEPVTSTKSPAAAASEKSDGQGSIPSNSQQPTRPTDKPLRRFRRRSNQVTSQSSIDFAAIMVFLIRVWLPGGAAIIFSQSWNFELKFFVDNPYVKKIGTRSF